jgi:signal transduction histidine kinase
MSLIPLLMVSENPDLLSGLERQFRDCALPYRLSRTASAAEALAQYENAACDIMLIDAADCPADAASRQRLAQWFYLSRMSLAERIISGMSHELNQPLAAIANYAVVLQHRLRDYSPEHRESLLDSAGQIARQIEQAGEIVRRLRAFARYSEGVRKETNVNALIKGALELMKVQSRLRGIELQSDLASELPPTILERDQIEQVVLNLIQNAIESIPEDKKTGQILVRTRRATNHRLEIAVIDNGTAAADDVYERIFEPFYTTKEKKMGLGLAIGRWIVQSHGGRLEGRRNIGDGMTFQVLLPMVGEGESA